MKTYEQLEVILEALEDADWVRLNGNTWADPLGQWRVQTAYTHREATVKLLYHRTAERRWVSDSNSYRGEHPLKWFMGYAGLLPTEKVLEAKLRK